MKAPENIHIHVGASRLVSAPNEWILNLAAPGLDRVVKDEPETLVGRLELPDGSGGVLKLYRHRDILNAFRGGVWSLRVQREFNGLTALESATVPCSAPLLWAYGQAPKHGRFELLVTREVPDARALKAVLARYDQAVPTLDWAVLFRMLRRMHERGVFHGALWPKNILVSDPGRQGAQFHLIDLARSVVFRNSIYHSRTGRADLLSLLYALGRANGALDLRVMLSAYGCSEHQAEALLSQARGYRSSRHARNWLMLRLQLRAVAGR